MIVNKDLFAQNLILTKHYCEDVLTRSTGNTASVLRSFNPFMNEKQLFKYNAAHNTYDNIDYQSAEWTTDPLDGNLIDKLFDQQLTHKRSVVEAIDIDSEFKGKILVADLWETVVDGASESQSSGFVDGYDIPPIDTWFYMQPKKNGWPILYAWIPEKFVPNVQGAIDVNCVDCLEWYEHDL